MIMKKTLLWLAVIMMTNMSFTCSNGDNGTGVTTRPYDSQEGDFFGNGQQKSTSQDKQQTNTDDQTVQLEENK